MPRLNVRLLFRALEERVTPDATPHNLAVNNFYQNWNTASLITANDDWSSVLSITGYLGDDTFGEGIDPQTILTHYSTIDVIANQGSNTVLTTGGVAEFDGLTDRVIALQADGTADAPNLVVSINTTGRANISISYNLRDIDGTADNAIQPVALQYRIGNAGNFVNVPSGFVADATTGPSLQTVTPVSVTLPGAVDNQAEVQVRIITANAVGGDEWVAVDDIVVGGKEFAINTYTTGAQFGGDRFVAMDADGDIMVVWSSDGQDGSGFGVYGQRFNSAGGKVATEFQINTSTLSDQIFPTVAMDADGDAVVVWQSMGQDGNGYGIYGQRFDPAGAKVGVEFLINTFTTGNQSIPSVGMDASGNTCVAWQSDNQDGSGSGVFGQRFDSVGAKVSGEFLINTHTAKSQSFPSVALASDGDAVVAWNSDGQDGSGFGVYGQRFDGAGAKVGVEFPINLFTTSHQRDPIVALDADGDAVVVWRSIGQEGEPFLYGVYGQRFNIAGAKVGAEFLINTFTTSQQRSPSLAIDADGDTIVVWESANQNGSALVVCGQRFDSGGNKVGTEFQVNTYLNGNQYGPSAAMDVDGDVAVVWTSKNQDGSSYGVYGQQFRSPNSAGKVSNIQVNDGSPQRSVVKSLTITFDSPVTYTGSPSAAFSLLNQKTNNTANLAAVVDLSGTMATLTFTGGSVDLGGSLSDGRYTLTINGNQFTGNGFDGNGDGIPGDNYLLIGSPANGLFRLFGDADGDSNVAANDFIQFRLALGGTSVIFDFDNDGAVAASDFIQFRLRFGGSI